mmetsp:Transcript_67455/g.180226  ORF Transcript_67455/g.180226 Transcript_67455/m.180226 type:complete len:217 (-) Transcript_67455:223-873(-)
MFGLIQQDDILALESTKKLVEDIPSDDATEITSFGQLVAEVDKVFATCPTWDEKQAQILDLLHLTRLSDEEVEKYVDWGGSQPYTRNLVASDGTNYNLLVLCWKAGCESRIHNHPCQGCFVLGLSGQVVETRYTVHAETDEIREVGQTVVSGGDVTYINDNVGLHKIGSASTTRGAVSLHLYTPPFSSCKVWAQSGAGELENFQMAKMEFTDHRGK